MRFCPRPQLTHPPQTHGLPQGTSSPGSGRAPRGDQAQAPNPAHPVTLAPAFPSGLRSAICAVFWQLQGGAPMLPEGQADRTGPAAQELARTQTPLELSVRYGQAAAPCWHREAVQNKATRRSSASFHAAVH